MKNAVVKTIDSWVTRSRVAYYLMGSLFVITSIILVVVIFGLIGTAFGGNIDCYFGAPIC